MKKLPLGIQSIEKILANNDYVYVDKTGFIKQLIDAGSPHYFMSRPRRFGKSLFVSTLEEIFNGTNITISYLRKVYNNNEEKQETIEKMICIEPGIDSKIPIILENQGHVYGNHIGNVEITLNELPHIQYKRNSLHLLMEKTISLKEALTGFSITFQHINNKQYTLQNNNITYPNSQREIPHLGLTNKSKTGSLFVVFNVEFPISLNEEQKQQLKTIL